MATSSVSAPTVRPSLDGIGFFETASSIARTLAMASSADPWNGQVAAGMHAAR